MHAPAPPALVDGADVEQVGVYHHVTGIDASSSASLAAYINTLTFSPHDKQHKVVSGLYWYEHRQGTTLPS